MEKIVLLVCIFMSLCIFSCKTKLVLLDSKEEYIPTTLNNSQLKISYEDFPNNTVTNLKGYYKVNYIETLYDIGGLNEGLLIYGVKDGLWENRISNTKVHLKEYFKLGLRDSTFLIYDLRTDTILYKTVFNMGTGLLKDYHANGQLYYEIQTQDGYFTDTLRLYNEKGILSEKLFYDRDSLVFYEKKNNSGEWEIQPRYILDERNKNR